MSLPSRTCVHGTAKLEAEVAGAGCAAADTSTSSARSTPTTASASINAVGLGSARYTPRPDNRHQTIEPTPPTSTRGRSGQDGWAGLTERCGGLMVTLLVAVRGFT